MAHELGLSDNANDSKDSFFPRYSLWDYIRGAFFFSIYGCVKYLPSPLGDVARGLCLRLFCKQCKTMRIKDGATFWFPHNISIGKKVSINEWVFIDGFGGVEIGDECRIAHGVSIISEDHDFSRTDIPIFKQGKIKGPILIDRDCWIGAGAKILKGIHIGAGCVIGAGSVVTKDLPPNSVAVGIPAKVISIRGGSDSG